MCLPGGGVLKGKLRRIDTTCLSTHDVSIVAASLVGIRCCSWDRFFDSFVVFGRLVRRYWTMKEIRYRDKENLFRTHSDALFALSMMSIL